MVEPESPLEAFMREHPELEERRKQLVAENAKLNKMIEEAVQEELKKTRRKFSSWY